MNTVIGKLAQLADVGIDTVRFCEHSGLLPEAASGGSFRSQPQESERTDAGLDVVGQAQQ